MKNTIMTVMLGIVALGAGLGLMVAADHYGWIGSNDDSSISPPDSPPSVSSPANIPTINLGEPILTAANNPADSQVMRVNRPPSATCANVFSTVQLATPEVAQRAGLVVEPVRIETIEETINANASIAFNGDRFAHLASRAAGVIAEVRADLGARVEAGDILAMVDSAELGSAKAAYLQARALYELREKNFAREQTLLEQEIGTVKDHLAAESSLVEARVQRANAEQLLRNLGLTESDIDSVATSNDTSSLLPLRAPFAGTIVERDAVRGEVIATTRSLFGIADLSTMWVMLDVSETDGPRLATGQSVTLSVDAMRGRSFEGTLTWISAHVDPRTRALRARAEVTNADGMLRANMFGAARVAVRTNENAILVSQEAVQWDGCCNVVFVRHTDTIYQPYQVTLGYEHDGYYVVERGLPAGESVVTQGSFLLKTEILKGSIGAGCCEVDPGAAE